MKNIRYNGLYIAAAFVIFVQCKPNLKAPDVEKGNLDVTKFVALGNSLTAGFADAALYYDGQKASFANMLAEQFKMIGGGEFVQPYVPEGSVGVGSSGNAKYVMGMKTDCKGVTALSPVGAAKTGDFSILLTSVAANGPFNNMGVPGAKAITAIYPGYGDPSKGTGNYNPLFTRLLAPSEYSTASMLAKAVAQQPTFFSVFLGNNDVLGYATGGGLGDVITPAAGNPGVGFDATYDLIVNSMAAGGAKGVLGNIPDVTSIPYFTTVPYNALTLDATQAAQLNAAYAGSGMTFAAGSNPLVIKDAAVPQIGMRQIKPTELVLLTIPTDSLKCGGWGSSKAIANQYILTETEIANVRNAVAGYNNKIKAVAEAKGLAYVDVNGFMAQVKNGMTYNGIALTTTFGSGGAFSLDGVHLTPRGNALLANEFIKAINSKYGSSIPHVDVSKYPGVIFP